MLPFLQEADQTADDGLICYFYFVRFTVLYTNKLDTFCFAELFTTVTQIVCFA